MQEGEGRDGSIGMPLPTHPGGEGQKDFSARMASRGSGCMIHLSNSAAGFSIVMAGFMPAISLR